MTSKAHCFKNAMLAYSAELRSSTGVLGFQTFKLAFLFLGCTHVMRRTCWCTKQWQNVAQVLHNNRTKFPKDFFHHCSVHQHGRRDVRCKPRYSAFTRWNFKVVSLWRQFPWIQPSKVWSVRLERELVIADCEIQDLHSKWPAFG